MAPPGAKPCHHSRKKFGYRRIPGDIPAQLGGGACCSCVAGIFFASSLLPSEGNPPSVNRRLSANHSGACIRADQSEAPLQPAASAGLINGVVAGSECAAPAPDPPVSLGTRGRPRTDPGTFKPGFCLLRQRGLTRSHVVESEECEFTRKHMAAPSLSPMIKHSRRNAD